MRVSDFIARRYLFAKKSHNVINIISIISAAGIAIGCAALVVILSVYNGFDSIVRGLNSSYTADVLVKPVEGKVFIPSQSAKETISSNPGIRACCEVLEENVFVQYDDHHAVVTARGVDSLYEGVTSLKEHVSGGEFSLRFGEIPQVVLGRTVALNLGANPAFLTPLEVYFPSRSAEVDLMNPTASLHKESLLLGGTVALEQNFDSKYMFIGIDVLRTLLEYDKEISEMEIYLNPQGLDRHGIAKSEVVRTISEAFGEGFEILDRRQQNETLYKLLKYEKIAIYLILLFVIVIISFNIFSSLSMLIIEKKGDIDTLKAVGADDKIIKRIFVKEGWLISLLGVGIGIIIGLVVCWLQQRFGFVKMPGNFVINAYPVVIQWQDVLLTALGVGLIGFIVSRLTNTSFRY